MNSNMRTKIPAIVLTLTTLVLVRVAYAGGELPGFYQEPGLNPNRATVNYTGDEHVDPFTGMVQLHHVDTRLPGNGGFDLVLTRSYNGPSPWYGTSSDPTSYSRTPNVGVGWNLLIGGRAFGADTACTGGTQMSFETPDGGRQAFMRQGDGTFLSAARWKAVCSGAGVKVYAPNGTRYDLLQPIIEGLPNTIGNAMFHYPTRIEDRNANYLTFSYTSSLLTRVDASDGRAVTFAYTSMGSGVQMLTMVTIGSKSWQYVYHPTPALVDVGGQGTQFFLQRVQPPNGGPWEYEYFPCVGGGCRLAQFRYPAGGGVAYQYDAMDFGDGNGPVAVVVGKGLNGALSVGGGSSLTTFAYTASSPGTNAKTTVTSALGMTVYTHVGHNTVGSGSIWRIGLLVEKEFKSPGGAQLQKETYTWDKQQISTYPTIRSGGQQDPVTYAPLMTQKAITRTGVAFTTDYSNFDAYGNPGTIAEAGGRTRTTTRAYLIDTTKWIIKTPANESISDLGNIVRSFDPQGNLLSETRFGVTTSYTYDPDGSMTSRTDGRNNTTHFSLHFRGTAQSEARPEGVTILRTVDADGNITAETDGAGNNYQYAYDGIARMISKTPPIGNPTTFAWTGSALRRTTRGPYVETLSLDGIGLPSVVKRDGVPTAYGHDIMTRQIFESMPGNVTENPDGSLVVNGIQFPRDILGRVTRVVNNDGTFRTVQHYATSVVETNERQVQTTRSFVAYGDPDQRFLTSINKAGAVTTAIGRNGLGQITSVAMDGKTRTYGYNGLYFLTSIADPETGTTTFGRDGVGNMTSRTTGGRTTNFTYDGLNRLTQISYPNSTVVTIAYLGNGRTQSVASPSASRSYTYDENANLLTETLQVGTQSFTVTYTYDGNDALASITYPRTAEVVTYAPDALGRPTQASPYVTGVSYFSSGNPKEMVYGSGVKVTLEETVQQRPFRIKARKADGLAPTFVEKQYAYDPVGNVFQIYDFVDPVQSVQMAYDWADQVIQVLGPWGYADMAYDGGGNLKTYNVGENSRLTYNYAADNKLASVTGRSFNYDGYGNVTSDGAHTYQYDDASNLVCVDCGTAAEIRYAYDGNNRRVSRTKGSEVTYYVHVASGELLFEYTPSRNEAIQHFYLHGKRVASKRVTL